MQDLAETYRVASDDEIARLNNQIDSLTEEARDSLRLEIARRKLSEDDLAQLREQLAEHAANVNQEWKESRKVDAARMGKRTVMRVALVIAAALIAALFALVHSAH
jgi:predicted RNA-binding Zn ribbon-like protein